MLLTLMIGNGSNRCSINEQGRLTLRNILLLDVANLVDPLLHGWNLRFYSVTEQTQVGWHRSDRILNEERHASLKVGGGRCTILVLLELEGTLH